MFGRRYPVIRLPQGEAEGGNQTVVILVRWDGNQDRD